jgi:fructokinase
MFGPIDPHPSPSAMRLLGFGEILWDLFEDQEHLGGAVLNFCVHASRLGHDVSLISAVGADDRGRRALEKLSGSGLSTRFVPVVAEQPTGIVTVTVDSGGEPSYVIHRPAAYDCVRLSEAELETLAILRPDWICYGTLHSMAPDARNLLRTVIAHLPVARRFYDVNLRRESFTKELVIELLGLAHLVKFNQAEARAVQGMFGTAEESLEAFCRNYAARFGWQGVCVTRGEKGCALLLHDRYEEVNGYPVPVVDTVGAGDAFAAAFLHGVHAGWPPRQVGEFANRLGSLVASRRGGIAEWSVTELAEPAP